MNRKLSILLTAALGFSLATSPVFAAPNAPSKNKTSQKQRSHQSQRRMNMKERFAKELNLTKAQQSKINPILKKHGEQTRAIHKNEKLSREQKRAQSTKLFEALPGKINKHLNKTQQAKLKQMVERRKNFRGPGKGKPGNKPGKSQKRK